MTDAEIEAAAKAMTLEQLTAFLAAVVDSMISRGWSPEAAEQQLALVAERVVRRHKH